MPRIAYVILCSCLIAFAGLVAGPADAGGRRDGYYVDVTVPPPRPHRIWYSTSCCYRKIVRHVGGVRQVRYVKIRPPREEHVWARPARVKKARVKRHRRYRVDGDVRLRVSYDRPRRHVDDDYADRADRCHRRRVRVLGADGGSVWALTARCY